MLAQANQAPLGVTEPDGDADAAGSVTVTVSLKEAAMALGCSVAALRRAVRSGRLNAEQIKGKRGPEYRVDLAHARNAINETPTPKTMTEPDGDADATVTRNRHRQPSLPDNAVLIPATEWRALLARLDTQTAEATAARERAARAEADALHARERASTAERERDQATGHLIELERARASAEGRAEALAATLTARTLPALPTAATPQPSEPTPARRWWHFPRREG